MSDRVRRHKGDRSTELAPGCLWLKMKSIIKTQMINRRHPRPQHRVWRCQEDRPKWQLRLQDHHWRQLLQVVLTNGQRRLGRHHWLRRIVGISHQPEVQWAWSELRQEWHQRHEAGGLKHLCVARVLERRHHAKESQDGTRLQLLKMEVHLDLEQLAPHSHWWLPLHNRCWRRWHLSRSNNGVLRRKWKIETSHSQMTRSTAFCLAMDMR